MVVYEKNQEHLQELLALSQLLEQKHHISSEEESK
jgi:hypothetical protein